MKLKAENLRLTQVCMGGLLVSIPSGFSGFFLEAHEILAISERWNRFLLSSPERTVYHGPAYLEFAAQQNGWGGLLCIEKEGQPYFAVPIHPKSGGGVTTGYSGVLFPVCENDRQLRTRIVGFAELLAVNRGIDIEVIQSAQAIGWDDINRRSLIASGIATIRGLRVHNCFSRIIDIEKFESVTMAEIGAIPEVGGVRNILLSFDSAVRNQIRHALRNGLSVKPFNLNTGSERVKFFEGFFPLHEASWARTGMTPHSRSYLEGLSRGIAQSGGSDVGVVVYLGEEPVAAVNVHIFRGRSLYWSGCSSEIGKKMNGNSLALFSAIVAAQMSGAKSFELGRFYPGEVSNKEIAITSYKTQFGGQIHPLFVSNKSSRSANAKRTARRSIVQLIRKVSN